MAKERNKPLECKLAVMHEGKFVPVNNSSRYVRIKRSCNPEFAEGLAGCVFSCAHYAGPENKNQDNHSEPIDITERCPRPRGVRGN